MLSELELWLVTTKYVKKILLEVLTRTMWRKKAIGNRAKLERDRLRKRRL